MRGLGGGCAVLLVRKGRRGRCRSIGLLRSVLRKAWVVAGTLLVVLLAGEAA